MGAGIFEKLGQVIKSARRGHLNIRYIYRYELFTVQNSSIWLPSTRVI